VIRALWWATALILYTYFGYPLLIWFLSRLRSKPWTPADQSPSVSIVMAVHNGAPLLPAKIEHLRSLDYPNLREIIIVSDGSSDATNSILEPLASDSTFRIIVLEEQVGKATALNAGIAAATSDVLLFVDVRPWIAPGAISQMMANFADPSVGCVAGELILSSEGQDAGAAAVGGMYWRYEQWIRDCESRFDSPLGVYGGFYAIRRELAQPFPSGLILDDMFQPLSIVRQGYRSVIDLKAQVHDAWPKTAADEFRRKVRTLAGNFQLLQLAPWLLTLQNRLWFQLVSHKLLRLIVPYLLAVVLVASLLLAPHSRFYLLLAAAQVIFYLGAWLGSRVKVRLLMRFTGVAEAFCMLNLAAVFALHRFLFHRGPLWKIWGAPQMSQNLKSMAHAQGR
jgi:glycosyltransferase involved in cell wall biosynthesis